MAGLPLPTSLPMTLPTPSASSFPIKLPDFLQGNPYFSAGAGLYGVAVTMMLARAGYKVGVTVFKRRCLTSIEMTNKDPSYQWILDWMSARQNVHFQHMSVQSKAVVRCNELAKSSFQLTPSPGRHFIVYKNNPILVERKRYTDRGTDVLETVELTTLGRTRKTMMELIDEAMLYSTTKELNNTVIYFNSGNQWTRFQQPRRKRPMQSVILDGTKKERLVRDVKDFLSRGIEYHNFGIPYRRGYLLYGPPGCGKSSFIYALAGEVDMAICVMNLSNKYLTDDSLPQLLNSAPEPSIILIEDVDHAFSDYSRITFSGLLNAIDGVAAQEGRMLFLTTNHIERLDPALIRPGRIDVQEEITFASEQQVVDMFARFFPDHQHLALQFARVVPADSVSMAKLQGYLFSRRDDPEAAMSDISLLLQLTPQQLIHSTAASAGTRGTSSSSSGSSSSSSASIPNTFGKKPPGSPTGEKSQVPIAPVERVKPPL